VALLLLQHLLYIPFRELGNQTTAFIVYVPIQLHMYSINFARRIFVNFEAFISNQEGTKQIDHVHHCLPNWLHSDNESKNIQHNTTHFTCFWFDPASREGVSPGPTTREVLRTARKMRGIVNACLPYHNSPVAERDILVMASINASHARQGCQIK